LQRVVHTAVHVDEAQGVYVLMACETAVKLHGTGSERALAPGVIGGVKGLVAIGVIQSGQAAKMVRHGYIGMEYCIILGSSVPEKTGKAVRSLYPVTPDRNIAVVVVLIEILLIAVPVELLFLEYVILVQAASYTLLVRAIFYVVIIVIVTFFMIYVFCLVPRVVFYILTEFGYAVNRADAVHSMRL
jgi:hypothetical protein